MLKEGWRLTWIRFENDVSCTQQRLKMVPEREGACDTSTVFMDTLPFGHTCLEGALIYDAYIAARV